MPCYILIFPLLQTWGISNYLLRLHIRVFPFYFLIGRNIIFGKNQYHVISLTFSWKVPLFTHKSDPLAPGIPRWFSHHRARVPFPTYPCKHFFKTNLQSSLPGLWCLSPGLLCLLPASSTSPTFHFLLCCLIVFLHWSPPTESRNGPQ